jgi:uncharacterized protein YjbI with pentapeptide repeats
MGNRSPDVRDRNALRTLTTAAIAIGGLALLGRLMERRGTAVDEPDQPAERTDTPEGQGEQEGAAPSATTSAAPVDVDGHRPDISRFGLPALAVAASLFAAFWLKGQLWPEMSTLQTLLISGLMLVCIAQWSVDAPVDAPSRRFPLSILVVVATVGACLYLAFRLQQLFLPNIPPGATLILVAFGVWAIFWWLSQVSRQRTTVRLLAAVVLGSFLLEAGIYLEDRLDFQIPDVLLIVVLVIFLLGLFLWWHERAKEGSRSELGAALLGGTVVAFAVLAFQWVLEQDREANAELRSLRTAIGMQSDLSGVDLSGRDLSGFYFRGKNLKNANLSDANLSKADLRDANLSGADLSRTDLTAAILSAADLPRADLTEADLTSADLAKANLAGAILARAHLNISNLVKANLTRAHLTGADLTDTKVKGANLTGALADSATILPKGVDRKKSRIYLLGPRADLRSADLSGADLTRQDLSRAKFGGANLTEANFSEANLSGADLSLAHFDGTELTDTRLQHANLTGTELADADLTGALADAATKWPKGARPRSLGVYVLAPRSDLHNADLSGLDLSGIHLSGADLSGANLSSAVLSGADLSLAHLNRANLESARLDDADLTGAALSDANLSSARLDDADLTGAALSGADLSDALASRSTNWPQGFDPEDAHAHVLGPGADLQKAVFDYADLSGFDLTGANLSGASLYAAKLFRTNLTGANLSDADLSYAAGDPATRWPQGFDVAKSGGFILGPGVNLTNADLSSQDVSGANLSGANLSGANLAEADLSRINFSGAHLSETDLSGADLTGANLTDADLTGIHADSATIWPQGFNPRAKGVELSD